MIVSLEMVASLPEQSPKQSDCKLHSIEDILLHVVEFRHPNFDNSNHDEEPKMLNIHSIRFESIDIHFSS